METTVCVEVFKIKIDGKGYEFDDPKPTGRQLIDVATKGNVENYVIFQFLRNGMMKRIKLDEVADLTQPKIEKFITFKTDRTFRFILDGKEFDWGAPEISGYTLKKLANVRPSNYDVLIELKDKPDEVVKNKKTVALSGKGVEKFKITPKIVTVCFNNADFDIKKGEYSLSELLEIFDVKKGHELILVIDGDFVSLKPGQYIKIKKGMKFISHAPKGESS